MSTYAVLASKLDYIGTIKTNVSRTFYHKVCIVCTQDKERKMRVLVLPQDGYFIEPFPPTPFKFEAESRERYSVRPEKKGVRIYWHMRKQINGRLFNQYVAKSGSLSHVLLENCAKLIEHQAGVQS